MASCMPHKGLFLLRPLTSFSEGVRGRPTGGERHGEAVEEVVKVADVFRGIFRVFSTC